jgi:hypothetical protein
MIGAEPMRGGGRLQFVQHIDLDWRIGRYPGREGSDYQETGNEDESDAGERIGQQSAQ